MPKKRKAKEDGVVWVEGVQCRPSYHSANKYWTIYVGSAPSTFSFFHPVLRGKTRPDQAVWEPLLRKDSCFRGVVLEMAQAAASSEVAAVAAAARPVPELGDRSFMPVLRAQALRALAKLTMGGLVATGPSARFVFPRVAGRWVW